MRFTRAGLLAVASCGVAAMLGGGPSVQAAKKRNTRTAQVNYYRALNARQQQQLRRQQSLIQRQQGQSRQQQEDASLQWQAMMLGELDGKVGLTDAQKAEVKPLLATEAKQITALGNERNLTTQQKQDQLAQLGDATWTKVDKLLTPEQHLKLDEEQANDELDQLAKLLLLTDDQKDKIGALLDDEAKQTQDVEGDKTLSQKEQQARLKEIDDATWEKIEPLLTADQQQKLETARQDDKLQELAKALTLTTSEKDKIKPMLEDAARQIHEARADTTLADPAKEDKQKQIRANMWAQIRQVLTTTQQKKLDELIATGKVTPPKANRGGTASKNRNSRNRT